MKPNKRTALTLLSVFSGLIFALFNSMPACSAESQIQKEKISFKQLGIKEDLQLKTVKSSIDIDFTRPKKWELKPETALIINYRQSPALLPERYSLTIFLNGNIVKTLKYKNSKSELNTEKILLPLHLMRDYNKLTFTVTQHYTYKCEDPFDTSLWTNISGNSYIDFAYSEKADALDFAAYPYPFFDELAYAKTQIEFALPDLAKVSDSSLEAMGVINSNLSSYASWRDVSITANSYPITDKNIIIVGTPEENSNIARYKSYLPFKMTNNAFTDEKGTPFSSEGILMLITNPNNRASQILFITGNTPEAVMKATKALTQNPVANLIKGNKSIVKQTAAEIPAELRDWKGYVHIKKTTLEDLGEPDRTVRGITALPIVYKFRIMPDMYFEQGSRAKLTVFFSHAQALDFNLSNLEIVLNGVSLHSKKLEKQDNDKHYTGKVELSIPVETLRLYNDLQFRFHIYPQQYDICRFTTDDYVWGTIYKTTKLELPAQIKAEIPNLNYLNEGGYPFTAFPDMQNVLFVMNNNISPAEANMFLQATAAFAKQMHFNNMMRFDVIKASEFNKDKHKDHLIIAIGQYGNFDFYKSQKLVSEATMADYSQQALEVKNSEGANDYSNIVSSPNLGLAEQIVSPFNNNRVLMLLYGKNETGLYNAATIFSDRTKFDDIDNGNIAVISENSVKYISNYPKDKMRYLYTEEMGEKKIFGVPIHWFIKGSIILLILWVVLKSIFKL